MTLKERTSEQEATFMLSYVLESTNGTFYHLENSLKNKAQSKLIKMLFVRTNIRNMISYYSQRSPISCEANLIAQNVLLHRRLKDAFVVFETDMPEMAVWKQFNEVFALHLSNTKTNPNSFHGYGTRGHNITHIDFVDHSDALSLIPFSFQHCCSETTFAKPYFSEIELRQLKLHKHYTSLYSGDSFFCRRCGFSRFVDTFEIEKLLQIHADILMKGLSK